MSRDEIETRAMTSLPTGTVTFLFTDIEGSTKLWQQHPVAMKDALARHNAILQQAIADNGGYAFQIIGDAFYAAFASAADALKAALAAQRGLQQEAWSETGPLRVRMGLHTGEAETRDGEYLSSPTLIRVQRCMDAGHGGQVLLTAAIQELVRDHLPAGVRLHDLGEHRLKDLTRPERLFQLAIPSLPSEFPPLRTLDAHPNNLPVQLTSFIGREHDLAAVKRLLTGTGGVTPPLRLLTLTGVGGTGKTRLSLQVASDLLETFPDGVWLVELASLSDPALVPQVVASALDVREQSGRQLMETVSDYLRSRQTLLVLDNCEHLIEACAKLAESLLHTCSHLKILATSREAIGITGESTWYVPSLSAPHPHHAIADAQALVSELTHYEAVRLFMDRALAVQPTFTLTNQNALTVAQICHQLDGIPLAIELAAARLKALTIEQIAARLDDRFNLLTVGSRTALPRQQTLRATIDWSYDLLSEAERVLLNRLSVFADGWTLEAAERVARESTGRAPSTNVLDLLTHLVDKSLVVMEHQDHEARYRLLGTIHQYAREKLLASGESETTQMRHLNFFLKLAKEAEPQLRSANQVRWLDRLEAEHDNLRAALDWALQCGEVEAGLQLAADLSRFWYLRGYWSEGRDWLARMLSAAAHLETPERSLALAKAKALCGAGWLADESGQEAAFYQESLALCREYADQWGAAFSLRGLGVVAINQDDFVRAAALLDESLVLFRELDDRWGIALAHFNWGWLASDQDDYERANTSWQASLRYFEQSGDRWGIAISLGAISYIARLQDDYKRATKLSKESLNLFKELGDKAGIATSLSRLANVAFRRDDFRQATSFFEESIALQRELGYERNTAAAFNSLGVLACYQGDYARANAMLEKSQALWREIGDSREMAKVMDGMALLALYQCDDDRANALWGESLKVFRERKDRVGMASAMHGLGRLAHRRGDTQSATELLEESINLYREVGDKQSIAIPLNSLARVAHAQRDDARAVALYIESLTLRRETGAKRGVAECLEGLAGVAAGQHQTERAARLFGAAQALREAIGAPLPPVEHADYDQHMAALRAQLGEAALATQWGEGRALTLEQAIAYALNIKHLTPSA